MVTAQPILPFPARMAAELALVQLRTLPPGSRVLDPMAGSGTVLRAAIEPATPRSASTPTRAPS